MGGAPKTTLEVGAKRVDASSPNQTPTHIYIYIYPNISILLPTSCLFEPWSNRYDKWFRTCHLIVLASFKLTCGNRKLSLMLVSAHCLVLPIPCASMSSTSSACSVMKPKATDAQLCGLDTSYECTSVNFPAGKATI